MTMVQAVQSCLVVRAGCASQLLVLKALPEPAGMVLGIASGEISKAGPCIVLTAMLGTCFRLSAKAAAENPNSVLHLLLTQNFSAITASFGPDLHSHLVFQDIPDDSVSFRSQ